MCSPRGNVVTRRFTLAPQDADDKHKSPKLRALHTDWYGLQKSDEGQDDRCIYGVSAMQGWRINMEDAHAVVLDLQALEGDEELKPADTDVRISYFGVYDGHGGDKVALYTGEHLHNIIAKQEAFKNKNFEQALKDGFLAIDRAILSG
jgi:protein phosphatase PTC2/3